MSIQRRHLIQSTGAAALLASIGQQAWAQAQIDTLKIVTGFAAGGTSDNTCRRVGTGLTGSYAKTVVVENRTGAGGTIAAAAVVREPADGYTLFLADVGPNAVSHTMAQLTYDPHTAFTPIVHAVNLPAVILMRPDLPYKTLEEFIAAAKAAPGKFNYASAGLGNWTHLFIAYFSSQAKIDQVNVVFRSGAEMVTAVLRGDADTAPITISTGLPHIREGKLRALAGLGAKPMPQLPDVPPVAKTIPGFDVAVWHGIVGPAGMEPALADRINAVFNQVLKEPATRKAIEESQHAEIVGGTPAQFDAFIKGELKRWPEVVKSAGIKVK